MRRLLVLAFLLTGCMPVSVSHYGTAKPLGRGNVQGGGGFMVPRDGGSGFNHGEAPGDSVTTHHAISFLLDNFDVYGAVGVTDSTDVSFKIWEVGAQLGVKQTLLNSELVKIAIGGYASAWASDDSSSENGVTTRHVSGQGTVLSAPLTISIHPSENVAFYGGPELSRWDTRLHHFTKKDMGVDEFSVKGSRFYEGAFAGMSFGKEVQFNVGATLMRESQVYPEEHFGGDSWYAYPYINLTGRFGGTKARPSMPVENPQPPPPPPPATPQ